LVINVPVIAESVAPNIRLQENSYNFGDVCCGTGIVKPVNIVNDSETTVELLLDLLDKSSHGTEYLFVSFVSQDSVPIGEDFDKSALKGKSFQQHNQQKYSHD
jgi:hypothetical protein